MRPGNAGSNTVADHIAVLTQAITQVPTAYRKHMLIRADGAGSSYGLLDWLTEQGTKRGRTIEYSVGFASNQNVRDAIAKLPNRVWTAAVDADGNLREGGDVAEITALMDLSGWPEGMPDRAPGTSPPRRPTVLVRRDRRVALPGRGDQHARRPAGVPARPASAHARVEDRIRHAKDSGLGRFPSRDFAINTAWAQLAAISADLIAWLRLLALAPELAKAEPRRCATGSCMSPPN